MCVLVLVFLSIDCARVSRGSWPGSAVCLFVQVRSDEAELGPRCARAFPTCELAHPASRTAKAGGGHGRHSGAVAPVCAAWRSSAGPVCSPFLLLLGAITACLLPPASRLPFPSGAGHSDPFLPPAAFVVCLVVSLGKYMVLTNLVYNRQKLPESLG